MHLSDWSTITAIFLVIIALVIIAYDVLAVIKGGNKATISRVIIDTSREWLIIPLFFGILMGHFFWPQATKETCKELNENHSASKEMINAIAR